MATYDIGDLVRISGTFQVSGADTDPTTVTISYRDPSDGSVTSKVYVTDPEVVKDATGQYHLDISVTAAGKWWYRFVGTGTAQAAEESHFFVDTTETA